MRFRFCGDNDCEDWVLPQIAALSKLSSVKMKLLCNEVVADIVNNQINFEKIIKLTSEAKFSEEDVKACVSAVAFIINNSSKFNVDSDTLSNELQQLGLPKEHSLSLCKVYSENFNVIQTALKRLSLKFNTVKSIKYEIIPQFLSSSHQVNAPTLQLILETQDNNNKFFISNDKLTVLIYELRQALQIMEEINI